MEYFDWGSQSIAQSKFQRTASFLGKGFQEDIRLLARQHISEIFSEKLAERTIPISRPRTTSPRTSMRLALRGRRTMQTTFRRSSSFSKTYSNEITCYYLPRISVIFFRSVFSQPARRHAKLSCADMRRIGRIYTVPAVLAPRISRACTR